VFYLFCNLLYTALLSLHFGSCVTCGLVAWRRPYSSSVIGCLHDLANVQQTSSISICWKFAGRLLDRVNTSLRISFGQRSYSTSGRVSIWMGRYNISVCNQPPRSTQPSIPPG